MPLPRPATPAATAAAAPAAVLAAVLLLSCAACSKPVPPETERPPEPQAAATQPAQAGARDATQLRDAVHAPIDRAKAVDGQVEDAAAAQRAAVDAQSGY